MLSTNPAVISSTGLAPVVIMISLKSEEKTNYYK